MAHTYYTGVDFYAELRGGKIAGTVLVVSRDIRNGTCLKCVAVPTGRRKAMPVTTWTSPDYLAKCVPVTEREARQIHPEIFEAMAQWAKSSEFRERNEKSRTPLQRANW